MSQADNAAPDCVMATRQWVEQFVVGHTVCPFAAREVEADRVRYRAVSARNWEALLTTLIEECRGLDASPQVETTLLVLEEGAEDFDDYLDLLALAERLMVDQGYEGVYQLASFHPDYCFADAAEDAVENYTNRSPWPLLHLLREASLSAVLEHHPDPEAIPERNMALMAELGRAQLAASLAKLQGSPAAE
ncbi:DUF1415 domain-containing protein [Franzmannia qiaohouensis]|uniref:DUF1415 domain-containing protein n=1 Tax=Franzmannia qiaohouensis TaxID=1329370 RepID=A0ABU1HHL9_9GAMM|nr:DUF1415 domain-containing protein [Halomonas qiaohouensis]MDR5906973.1 DUF1415 domain-containing protein [Halomonas qiaohouensis]